MTHDFTDAQLEAVVAEMKAIAYPRSEGFFPSYARLILQARAERDVARELLTHPEAWERRRLRNYELAQERDAAIKERDELAASWSTIAMDVKAERDAALARVRELQEGLNEAMASLHATGVQAAINAEEYRDACSREFKALDAQIAALEAENAELWDKAKTYQCRTCSRGYGKGHVMSLKRIAQNERLRVAWESMLQQPWSLYGAADIVAKLRAAMDADDTGLMHDRVHKDLGGRAAKAVKVKP